MGVIYVIGQRIMCSEVIGQPSWPDRLLWACDKNVNCYCRTKVKKWSSSQKHGNKIPLHLTRAKTEMDEDEVDFSMFDPVCDIGKPSCSLGTLNLFPYALSVQRMF